MKFAIIVPFMLGLTMIFLRFLVSKRKEKNGLASERIYGYDPTAVGMLLVMLLVILSVPLWLPYVQPGKNNDIVYKGCNFISSIGLIGCFWLYAFRVKVFDDFIEYGAIFNKKIFFKDIERVKIAKNDAKGILVIYPNKGFRVTFSYTLSNYQKLKSDIEKTEILKNKIEYF